MQTQAAIAVRRSGDPWTVEEITPVDPPNAGEPIPPVVFDVFDR